MSGPVLGLLLVVPGHDRVGLTLDVVSRGEGVSQFPIKGGVVVQWTRASEIVYPGERITVEGTPRVAIAEVNPGVNGYEKYLRNRGVHSAIDASGPNAITRIESAPRYSPWYWAARLRQIQARNLAQAMPEDVLPFVYAIWLGHQSALRHDEYQDYVWSGTAHILSVSGIHAAIIAFTLNFALRVLQLARRPRAIIVMSAVCAFALVAARCPALRAAPWCLYLPPIFEREPDTPTALSIADIFILWDPRSVFDIGFQLIHSADRYSYSLRSSRT